jgi:hypothetical protein
LTLPITKAAADGVEGGGPVMRVVVQNLDTRATNPGLEFAPLGL